jgi:signal transduction histidine kinase
MEEDTPDLLPQLAGMASIAIRNVRAYEKTRELDRLKSEFVAVVSHEVRTPLTSIKGSLEILTDQRYFDVSKSQGELLEISRANVERLEQLVNDILDFSKLESGRLSTTFEEIRPEILLESAVRTMHSLASRNQIQVQLDIDGSLPVVWADELRLTQVVNNLLANGIKFSPQGSKIQIHASEEDGGLRVDVADSGIGIASEDIPKLFLKFQQLDSSNTRKAGGTGLGLVISKGIVEEHGGRIWVESEKGEGSTFSFWIPPRPVAKGEAELPEAKAASDSASPR